MILRLIWAYFKIGLFSIGGGLATIPYLIELAKHEDWFTVSQLTDMIAISQSTPGPVGINMATFSGYHAAGLGGGILTSIAMVIPSMVIIILVAKFLENFSENKYVKGAFFGIRPVVTAVIAVAVFELFKLTLFTQTETKWIPNLELIIIAVIITGLMQIKKVKKIHPALWFVVGAVIGIVFQL